MAAEKKGFISEEDVSSLLQRYSATTILALLQEVSQFAGVKMDWKTLVKKTSTGISSAREYQTLWRHLAYREILLEKLEDGAEPLDVDSDLEFEVEAVPAVSGEASSEAAACVKVLISSGAQRESFPTNRSTLDAPLTINVPHDPTACVPSEKHQIARCSRGTNIFVPVSVQKQPLHSGPCAEILDENGCGLPAKKKRKAWTNEEDKELIAAVEKCGEGNWATILKGDFKRERTASQLSQRWNTIRRRNAHLNQGSASKASGVTRTEERLAAQKAMTLFIDMPMTRSTSTIPSVATQSAISILSAEALSQNQTPAEPKGASQPPNKQPRTNQKKPPVPMIPPACPNSSIQAAAFAAGGRIAAPSTAASLFKAAQSKSAVHIRPLPPKLLPATNTPSSLGQQWQARPSGSRLGKSAGLATTMKKSTAPKLTTQKDQDCLVLDDVEVDDLLLEEEIEAAYEMELDGPDEQTGLPGMDLDETEVDLSKSAVVLNQTEDIRKELALPAVVINSGGNQITGEKGVELLDEGSSQP